MNPKRERERGQVLILTALFLVVLLVAGALAIDYSSWLVARRDYQAVVDAAALAGAAELPPPGVRAATSTDQQNASREALVYLSGHLGWGKDRAWAQGEAASVLNNPAPLVVTAGGSTYCVWVWTPTPPVTVAAGSDPSCHPSTATKLYAPANYPSDAQKVFVSIESRRTGTFSNVAGIASEQVGALAVAGTVHLNYAVIALKPRLGSPDNGYGVTITGNSILRVPIGDVGGNYTLAWGGSSSQINFPTAGLDQVVDLEEPQTVQGSGSVVGGTIEQLGDYPIPDPAYMVPQPSWCQPPTGATNPYAAQCLEPHPNGAATAGVWLWPPDSGGPTGKGVYPACATNTGGGSDTANHRIACADGSTQMLWPGMYEYVSIPNSVTTVILSPYCYGDPSAPAFYKVAGATPDSDCINNGRAGIFYFQSGASQAGLQFNGSGSTLSGCGVFLMFDPRVQGGSNHTLFKVPSGNTVNLNSDAQCPNGETMEYGPGAPGGNTSYKWYGYNSPDTNPVSVWVRPNLKGYDMSGSNGGSGVMTMAAGATIRENGVIYGPQDNTTVSGNPSGSGVGQIVTWTITYTGGSVINETYQGPGLLRTRLWQ
jgi:Flp pilus assembly protein TadG